MPSSCVHLYAAQLLADRFDIDDLPGFYLGSVAPDAVNLNGFAAQPVRYAAHIRSTDYNEWKQNIRRFYEENNSQYPRSYLLGFLAHLYTDIAWDELVQPGLFEFLSARGLSYGECQTEKWRELDRLDGLIIGKEWYQEMLDTLKKGTAADFPGCDKATITAFRDKLACRRVTEQLSPPLYLNEDMIILTADEVYRRIENLTE